MMAVLPDDGSTGRLAESKAVSIVPGAFQNDSGFELTAGDQLEINRFLATEAHERGLLIGLKNNLEQIPDLDDSFRLAC